MENNQEKKQTVLSLIQPTGTPTLGNYLGALKNWKNMSDGYDCFFGVADLHSITVRPNPADLRRRTTEMYAHTKTRCLFRATFPLMHSLRGFLTAIPNSERLQE
jgi:hypothetical protein